MRDLKLVYQAVNKDAAEKALDNLEIKWGESDYHQELARQLGPSDHLFSVFTAYREENIHHQYCGRISSPASQGNQGHGSIYLRYRPGKTCISRIYENPDEVDATGPELGPDRLATGNPVPGQVQDHILTTSFIWSSLTILVTYGAVLEY